MCKIPISKLYHGNTASPDCQQPEWVPCIFPLGTEYRWWIPQEFLKRNLYSSQDWCWKKNLQYRSAFESMIRVQTCLKCARGSNLIIQGMSQKVAHVESWSLLYTHCWSQLQGQKVNMLSWITNNACPELPSAIWFWTSAWSKCLWDYKKLLCHWRALNRSSTGIDAN